MGKVGKKYTKACEKVGHVKTSSISDVFNAIKNAAYAKFDESIDVDVNLGIDASKGDQVVRGSVVLPHAKGKQVKVLVFAKGDYAEKAQKAGADFVGVEDLIEKITGGWVDFDYAIATPDLMGVVGTVAKILGPKGLLPNKKLGTVTFDVAEIISDLKKGRTFFKNDKGGNVHFSFGKASFDLPKLQDNLAAFVKALVSAKPPASKGKFLKKMTVSSTMGPGIVINPDDLLHS